MDRSVISVDGIDGSGKSWFARGLVQRCQDAGVEAVLLHTDGFRRAVSWEGVSPADTYYDDYFDLAAADAWIESFLGGAAEMEVPRFDSMTGRELPARPLECANASVVVFEGVFTRRVRATTSGPLIYLVAPEDEARRRILERDTGRGRAREDVLHRLEQRYIPGQRRYHAEHDPRAQAHVVIDNSDAARPRVLRADVEGFTQSVRNLLRGLGTPAS